MLQPYSNPCTKDCSVKVFLDLLCKSLSKYGLASDWKDELEEQLRI